LGLPISASHALIGGLIGSAVSAAGFGILNWSGILTIVLFIFGAPLIGLLGAVLFSIVVLRLSHKKSPFQVNEYFKKLQLISVSVYSLGHGTNDAQKTMGIISLLLFSAGMLGKEFFVPFWVVLLSHATIAAGTLAGGWKVVKTMGIRLTNLKPLHGFCAESSGALTIIACSVAGIPVSTTHVICGSIAGVGLTKRASAVRWKLFRKIVWAWILTIPISALMGFVGFKVLNAFL
jgi:PiT family inorganic phosphate transporter